MPDEPPESEEEESSEEESFDDANNDSSNGVVTLENHPIYSKYFKMLKVGMPREIVSGKMKQDGIDSSILTMDPTSVAPDNFAPAVLGRRRAMISRTGDEFKNGAGSSVPFSNMPVSSDTVKPAAPTTPAGSAPAPPPPRPPAPSRRDTQESIVIPNVQALNVPPTSSDDDEKVPASEHPVYSKYFKMMKVGLPRHAVAAKLQQDGLDTAIADLDPQSLVSLLEIRPYVAKEEEKAPVLRAPRISQVRKKKLFLTAVSKASLNEDSLWADDGGDLEDIKLDSEEFDRLFVESADAQAKLKTKAQMIEEEDQRNKMKKIKGVTLISLKRAQNAAIALARIKLSYEEIRNRIEAFDDSEFTVEQLRALVEFLATEEEALLLQRFEGDVNDLGLAEKYMLTMLGLVGAKVRLNALIVRKQFLPRWHDCRSKFKIIGDACDEIKKSVRLRKVLKTILKVANQLNDEKQAGITVESLVKLATIKAFDKKTSILQYVIMLIYRHDEDALKFPDDLVHLNEAARLGLDSLTGEKNILVNELNASLRAMKNLHEHRCSSDDGLGKMIQEIDSRFTPLCGELDKRVVALTANFQSILKYFCEDPKLTCQEFFLPLSKFVEDFIRTRDTIERQRQAEERKKRIEEAKKDKAKAPNMAQAKRRLSMTSQPGIMPSS